MSIKHYFILFALSIAPLASEDSYFKRFETLAKEEMWEEIVAEATTELEIAVNENRLYDQAKICAQLTSTFFYLGNYEQALVYAKHCHKLSEMFTDPSLYLRALYLESAVYRAYKEYPLAVEIAEEALRLYYAKGLENPLLLGKIYFNLGAAHADNPMGNLSEAEKCYSKALECSPVPEDIIRITIRLGKVYLLQKNFERTQQIIDEIRPQITQERLTMHADYLEAQLKLALNDLDAAIQIAQTGLHRAQNLGAKEDESRFLSFLKKILDAPASLP
jgi:tetratricopeptide (TPR) repeat protein